MGGRCFYLCFWLKYSNSDREGQPADHSGLHFASVPVLAVDISRGSSLSPDTLSPPQALLTSSTPELHFHITKIKVGCVICKMQDTRYILAVFSELVKVSPFIVKVEVMPHNSYSFLELVWTPFYRQMTAVLLLGRC